MNVLGNRIATGLLACMAAVVQAEDRDLASLHQFNVLFQTQRKGRLLLHSRIRLNDNLGDFYQFRAGPIFYYDWTDRLQSLAGYYLVEQRSDGTLTTIQRLWVGAQIKAYRRGKAGLDWRTLVERHLYSGPGDFTRVRTRAMANFQPRGGWQPYASAEALALKGHVIGRYTAGLNYATESGHLFGFGYEFRQDVGKPGAHVIATIVQFRISGPQRREKPGGAEVPQ